MRKAIIEMKSNISLKVDLENDGLMFPPNEYSLDENSLFFDIGSGFGFPQFAASFLTNCTSHGVEINETKYRKSIEIKNKLSVPG